MKLGDHFRKKVFIQSALVASVLVLGACASEPQVYRSQGTTVYRPGNTEAPEVETTSTADSEEAAQEAIREEELARQEQARRAEEARQEAIEQEREEARLAAIAAEQAREDARRAAETARIEAIRRQEQQQAAEIARQEERISQLESQIDSNNAKADELDQLNRALRRTVESAETLNLSLNREQAKYGDTDPETGFTINSLDKERLEALKAQKEQLEREYSALMAEME